MTHLNIPVEVLSEVSGTNLPSIRRAFQLLKILQSLRIMYTTRKGNLMLVGPASCMLMYKQLQKCKRTERQIIVFKIKSSPALCTFSNPSTKNNIHASMHPLLVQGSRSSPFLILIVTDFTKAYVEQEEIYTMAQNSEQLARTNGWLISRFTCILYDQSSSLLVWSIYMSKPTCTCVIV